MKRALCTVVLLFFTLPAFTQQQENPAEKTKGAHSATLVQLRAMTQRFAPTPYKVDISSLSQGDRAALKKLIEAAHIMDAIQLAQRWQKNPELYTQLQKETSPLGKARLHYFWINKGPWSNLDGEIAFMPDVPEHKPLGAGFYPEDANKAELESWMASLPADQQEEARGFFTVIRRDENGQFKLVPYSQEYAQQLGKAAQLLHEAAELTSNASLKKFLNLRADAFLSNDYYASDVAWMDLDSDLDITIGPYETYNDELFGYKAAFEAYVNVRDQKESDKLKFLSAHLQEIENNLPIPAENRNPKLGALSPIVVVNEIFGAGDGNMGVQTAAYNLPNDERVIREKGAKRVMLKNVQEAKFRKTLIPISRVVLTPAARNDLDFDYFFTHILAHELTHGLGPHVITLHGAETSPRKELKELYGAIEEAKADVTGLFAVQFLMDKGVLKDLGHGPAAERKLYNTYLASCFRTIRFGVREAHARGMAMQINYLMDKGAYVVNKDGSFRVDFSKIKAAVRDLDHDLLMLEANGDYAGAKKMLDELGVIRPEVQRAIDRLKTVPTDIEPEFVTANQIAPAPSEGTKKTPKSTSSNKSRSKSAPEKQ
jgi:hypothetical protein